MRVKPYSTNVQIVGVFSGLCVKWHLLQVSAHAHAQKIVYGLHEQVPTTVASRFSCGPFQGPWA